MIINCLSLQLVTFNLTERHFQRIICKILRRFCLCMVVDLRHFEFSLCYIFAFLHFRIFGSVSWLNQLDLYCLPNVMAYDCVISLRMLNWNAKMRTAKTRNTKMATIRHKNMSSFHILPVVFSLIFRLEYAESRRFHDVSLRRPFLFSHFRILITRKRITSLKSGTFLLKSASIMYVLYFI